MRGAAEEGSTDHQAERCPAVRCVAGDRGHGGVEDGVRGEHLLCDDPCQCEVVPARHSAPTGPNYSRGSGCPTARTGEREVTPGPSFVGLLAIPICGQHPFLASEWSASGSLKERHFRRRNAATCSRSERTILSDTRSLTALLANKATHSTGSCMSAATAARLLQLF